MESINMGYDKEVLIKLDGLVDAMLSLLNDTDMSDDSANQFRDELWAYLNPQQVRLHLIIKNLK